jgi:hypothetical protein
MPIHRPAPEHFKLTEIGKDRVSLAYGGEYRHPSERSVYEYNQTWSGGRLHLTNRAGKAEDGKLGERKDSRAMVDLHAEASLKPDKRYRLTWACWPVGALRATEVSCDFDLTQRPAGEKLSRVALELSAAKTTVKEGQDPGWSVHLVNRGKHAVTLVQPGDGSMCGWRTPCIEWLVAGEGKRGKDGRCGNINRLKAEEVFILKPGERIKLRGGIGQPSIHWAGTYKVSLRYSNIPDLKWQGVPLGKHDRAAMAQVQSSTRLIVESNVVEIKVVK